MLLAAGAASSTSVPTWLAVLAIITPVVTAWIGALLAWLAATRTAERNAALSRHDEQRRWNRERREKAYVKLLDRRNQLVEVRRRHVFRDLHPSLTEGQEDADEGAAREAFFEALAELELVGTARAVELGRTWIDVLTELVVEGPDALLGYPVRRERECRDRFVTLIRKELGVDD